MCALRPEGHRGDLRRLRGVAVNRRELLRGIGAGHDLKIGPGSTGLDEEVAELVWALNRLPGIETSESCCGHGTEPFNIWFRCTDFLARGLLTIARLTCPRYGGGPAIRVELYHGDIPEEQVSFLLEGGVGDPTYAEADRLAARVNAHVDGTCEHYNILLELSHDEKAPNPQR